MCGLGLFIDFAEIRGASLLFMLNNRKEVLFFPSLDLTFHQYCVFLVLPIVERISLGCLGGSPRLLINNLEQCTMNESFSPSGLSESAKLHWGKGMERTKAKEREGPRQMPHLLCVRI